MEEDFPSIAVPGGSQHHTALRLYGVNCTACVSPLRGDKGEDRPWRRKSISERCNVLSGAINTIPAAKPRSVVKGRMPRQYRTKMVRVTRH